jgi:thioredoxin 1
MTHQSQRAKRFLLHLSFTLACGLALAPPAHAADTGRMRESSSQAAKVLSASGFSFERMVLRADVPVIVDFWAPWCIPCRQLDGPMNEVAAKLGGRVRVVRVNLNWSAGVAHRYGVESLPTVLVFKSGQLVSRLTGGASAQDLEDLLNAPAEPAKAEPATAGTR